MPRSRFQGLTWPIARAARKSWGPRIAIPRNGWSASRSLSPDTIWVALPLTANSRNLLSLASRHTAICSVTSTCWAFCNSAARNSRRNSAGTYLLNLGRRNTSSSSATVASETSNVPLSAAASNACRGAEWGSSTGLTAMLVSMTVRDSLIAQQGLQDFRGQAERCRMPANLVHDFLQRAGWAGSQFTQAEAEQKLQPAPVLGRGGRE